MPRNQLSEFEKRLRKEIAINLKKHTRNITQKRLSEITEIPSSTLSGYFAERSTINPGNTQKIADALNIDKSDIDPRFKDEVFEKVENSKSVNNCDRETNGESAYKNDNCSSYIFYDTGISAGVPDFVNGFTGSFEKTITLPDEVMSRYAGDCDIFVTKVNGNSMNNIMPHSSIIAVKRTDMLNLKDSDIVVFRFGSDLSIKRYYHDSENKRFIFKPDSTFNTFADLVISYEESEYLQIFGRVVVYIARL